jgi:hypothetical protein
MADESPDKIIFGIGQGSTRAMVRLADGTYAERVAISAGAGLVTDSSGKYTFDLGSLASRPDYDADGNQVKLTYGPDQAGRYVQQTSKWGPNNRWMGDSAWHLVDKDGNEVEA